MFQIKCAYNKVRRMVILLYNRVTSWLLNTTIIQKEKKKHCKFNLIVSLSLVIVSMLCNPNLIYHTIFMHLKKKLIKFCACLQQSTNKWRHYFTNEKMGGTNIVKAILVFKLMCFFVTSHGSKLMKQRTKNHVQNYIS